MCQINFIVNIVQMSCCCFVILLGAKWFRFATARWIFGTVSELSHPIIIHQYSLWWFAPSVSLLVLNVLALSVDEDVDVGADARQKMAFVTGLSYTLWGIMNNAFPFLSQKLWDFEWPKDTGDDAYVVSQISNFRQINIWPVVGWGIFGGCGTCAIRNFMYFCDVDDYDTAITVIGVIECVILGTLSVMFIVQFGLPTWFPECCGSTKGHDVTKNYRLKAPKIEV